MNGENLNNVGHVEARMIITRTSKLMRFILLRVDVKLERAVWLQQDSLVMQVKLLKPPSTQLGIKVSKQASYTRTRVCLCVIK